MNPLPNVNAMNEQNTPIDDTAELADAGAETTETAETAGEIRPLTLEELELGEDALRFIAGLQGEIDEAVAARQRAMADFKNFQRRSAENEVRALQAGAANVLRGVLPVADHLELALGQPAEQLTVAQLLDGVRMAQDELSKALTENGVERIVPEAGDEFDPTRHEAMLRQESPGVPANHIVAVMQPGFERAGQVLRPAKVIIAPGDDA